MKKQNDQKTQVPEPNLIEAQKELWKMREVPIKISIPFLDDISVTFFFKVLMSSEEKQMRQDFSGLTQEQKEETRREYHIKLATSLITRLPEGVPDLAAETKNLEESRKIFQEFFSLDYPVNDKILDDALGLYFARVLPREYLQRY